MAIPGIVPEPGSSSGEKIVNDAFRDPVLVADHEIDAAQHEPQQSYFSTYNESMVLNAAAFPELYGSEPAPEPEIIRFPPTLPLSERIVAGACRLILRAKKAKIT